MRKSGVDDPASASEPTGDSIQSARKTLTSKTFKDGAIYLFQRGDYLKPIWFCRLKVPGVKGYIYRSTRTSDEYQAFKFADDLYNHLLVKTLGGTNIKASKIVDAVDLYIKANAKYKSRRSIHNKILLVERIRPFLEKRNFGEFDTAFISQLTNSIVNSSRSDNLSPNTIKRIYSDLKHFLVWCADEGFIDKLPKFPRVSSENSRRPHFDNSDWRKLTRHLREYTRVENKAVFRDRKMLVNYVLILANTGIRVGEARTLKWRDVRQVVSGKERNIVLTVKGKTGLREVVARTSDVRKYFREIFELRTSELEKQPDPDSLVFSHKDGEPIGSFKKSFSTLIKAANVEKDTFGQTRTIYSLRHTYATFRLHEGVNHYALAKNMGTSVAMIEQFYGHTTNIASANELTKMRQSGQSPRAGDKTAGAMGWLTEER